MIELHGKVRKCFDNGQLRFLSSAGILKVHNINTHDEYRKFGTDPVQLKDVTQNCYKIVVKEEVQAKYRPNADELCPQLHTIVFSRNI